MKTRAFVITALLLPSLTGCTGGASSRFNYETASREQREAFIRSEVEPMVSRLKSRMAAVSFLAGGIKTSLSEVDPEGRSAEILVALEMDQDGSDGQASEELENMIYAKNCTGYLQSNLAKNRVSVGIRMEYGSGGTAAEAILSQDGCAQHS